MEYKLGDLVSVVGYASSSKDVDGLNGPVIGFSRGCVIVKTTEGNHCVKPSQCTLLSLTAPQTEQICTVEPPDGSIKIQSCS